MLAQGFFETHSYILIRTKAPSIKQRRKEKKKWEEKRGIDDIPGIVKNKKLVDFLSGAGTLSSSTRRCLEPDTLAPIPRTRAPQAKFLPWSSRHSFWT